MRILVTGANGFIGRSLCSALRQYGHTVRAATRSVGMAPPEASESVAIGNIGASTQWKTALSRVDAVVHLAARVHVLQEHPGSAELYMDTNANGTRKLADSCVQMGVPRMVLLSSIKVNGESTQGSAFRGSDQPRPLDAYGESKWRAEKYLMECAARTGLTAVIVRPPLVYGPGVRANFLRLMRWIDREAPLPLGAIENRRSLVSVWNLCDALTHVVSCSGAQGRPWLVSDGEDVSTTDLIHRIAFCMKRRTRLISVPASLLMTGGALIGRRAEVQRLCESLVVDSSPLRTELNWVRPLTLDSGLARTVDWYLKEARHGVA